MLARLSLVSVLALAGCGGPPPPRTGPAAPSPRVELRLATRGKKVYPLTIRNARYWLTDVKLPSLVISNRGREPVTVESMVIEGLAEASGAPPVTLRFPGARLVKEQAAANAALKKALDAGAAAAAPLGIALGALAFSSGELATGQAIPPGKSGVLPLFKLAHLQYAGTERLTRLRFIARVSGPGGAGEATLTLPLLYRSPAAYRFPLRGQVTLGNLALTLGHHRAAQSQEFGFDILSMRPAEDGQVSSEPPRSKKLDDYFVYGREVLAIADGVVVELGDRFPEERSIAPTTWSPAASAALFQLAPAIGLVNALAGNYLVIDHGRGEHSVYGHLQQGSIRPKVGARVKRGEAIAKVGSTGNSSEPHLHFQLQDGKDFLTANGLPVTFEDARTMDALFGIEANAYWGTTVISLPVK